MIRDAIIQRMSKLLAEDSFFDFSDYGRKPGRWIAEKIQYSKFNAVHVTLSFFVCGLISVYLIYKSEYIVASILLIVKSILDAADGELARIQKKPSFIGRYLDSILDLVLNFILFFSFGQITNTPFYSVIICFFLFQLQGTVYNYYYLIVRNISAGADKTSRVNESSFPKALHGENQKTVNILFIFYTIFYRGFDLMLIFIDRKAQNLKKIPNWFMTLISLYGLGFQLLIISLLLSFELIDYIIPFFLGYSLLIPTIIIIRKTTLKTVRHDTHNT